MITVIDAIKELGGKSVSVVDNSLDEIYWNRGNPLNITKEQIKEKYDELVAEYNAHQEATQYQRDRQPEYPSIQDQLDMQYWDKVNGTNNWQEAIEAVKTKHPKPE